MDAPQRHTKAICALAPSIGATLGPPAVVENLRRRDKYPGPPGPCAHSRCVQHTKCAADVQNSSASPQMPTQPARVPAQTPPTRLLLNTVRKHTADSLRAPGTTRLWLTTPPRGKYRTDTTTRQPDETLWGREAQRQFTCSCSEGERGVRETTRLTPFE